MNFVTFIRLLIKNWKLLLLLPLAMGVSIYFFTKKEKKFYTSESVVYTGIASGYSLEGGNKADYYATSNAFDNLLTLINSRDTKEDVALSLLASHLFLNQPDPSQLSLESYQQLRELVPANVRSKIVKSTLEDTKAAISTYMQSSDDNLIYRIINSDNSFYSVDALRGINAMRINSSDLIKISYETNDAAICKHTLELLEEVFIRKHRLLREGQTSSVIAYFEREVRNAFRRLDSCENIFLQFNKQNDIINYYEQTKAVAGERENLYALNHTLKMDQQANNKAVAKVNDDLKGKVYQTLYGSDLISQREQLGDLYNKIAFTEVVSAGTQKRQLDSLKNISKGLENKLQASIKGLYAEGNTPKGIPVKSVLDEWVKKTIDYEQSKARLSLMDQRKTEFTEEYRKLAPLGAMLKKIERQITVAEQEYLELLHGLSLARLTQQNNELTSKLTVVDPAYLPIKANASKRMVMIIVGALAGFIITLALLLVNFFLNKTLQNPNKAKKKIGLPLLSIYPLMNESPAFIAKADLRMMQQFVSKIDCSKCPVTIGVISNQKSEGKSSMIDLWLKELGNMNFKVEKTAWKKDMFLTAKQASDILFIEFPPLEELTLTPNQLPTMDHVILVSRANRIWTKIDEDLLKIFTRVSGITPMLVLNGVTTDDSEEYIGEVPKKRGFIREFIKRTAKMEFGNSKMIYKQHGKDKRAA